MTWHCQFLVIFILSVFWRTSDAESCVYNDTELVLLRKEVRGTRKELSSLKEEQNRTIRNELDTVRKELAKLIKDQTSVIKSELEIVKSQCSCVKNSSQFLQKNSEILECHKGMSSTVSRSRVAIWSGAQVLCDTETDGGGWIIIQRRTKGDVTFYRGWSDYKKGFGTPDTDFWIGNDVIHNLTSRGYTELRVDLEYNGTKYFAHYSNFSVGDEVSKYKLSVSGYSGTAGDSLAYHDGMKFTTFDQDNDLYSGRNCAEMWTGAWWYKSCYHSNLNGEWGRNDHGGVVWWGITADKSATPTEMKIRRV